MSAENNTYPTTKEILCLLGVGGLLTVSLIMPGLSLVAGAIIRSKNKRDFISNQKAWKKFNRDYLKRNLKRLHRQKVVEVISENGIEVVKLTRKGKSKYFKFRLQELFLKAKIWDKKWYLVLYDIAKVKRNKQDSFRRILKQMHFLRLQKSAYLTPFKCNEELEFLREYFGLSEEVLILTVSNIENENYYKDYFGI